VPFLLLAILAVRAVALIEESTGLDLESAQEDESPIAPRQARCVRHLNLPFGALPLPPIVVRNSPYKAKDPSVVQLYSSTMGDVETGLFLGRIPYIKAGSGSRTAVIFFGANALFKRLDTSDASRYAAMFSRLLPPS
jgi:hypothetical protein